MLRELQALTEEAVEIDDSDEDHPIRDPDGSISTTNQQQQRNHEAFAEKVLQIENESSLVKKLILFLCRHRLLERHFR